MYACPRFAIQYMRVNRSRDMTVSIRPDLREFVDSKVRAGEYDDPTDVVNDALVAFRDQEQLSESDVAELRAEIELGLAQLDRGEGSPLDMAAIKSAARVAHQNRAE